MEIKRTSVPPSFCPSTSLPPPLSLHLPTTTTTTLILPSPPSPPHVSPSFPSSPSFPIRPLLIILPFPILFISLLLPPSPTLHPSTYFPSENAQRKLR